MNSVVINILLHHLRPFYSATTGRPRALALRYVLDRIAHVLRTGCQWSQLHVQGGSWKTIYHYFAHWSKAHVFENAFHDLVQFYLKRNKRPSKTLVVDTSFVKNVWGRDCLGRSPVDRGRKATKVSAITDAQGTPLYLLFHPGNKNDGKTLAHMIGKVAKRISLQGRCLYGDKAYDTQPCQDVMRRHGLRNCITKRRQPNCPRQNRTRIVVEHAFAWLDKYRRNILRYDGLVCHFRSFHYLAVLNLVASRLCKTD